MQRKATLHEEMIQRLPATLSVDGAAQKGLEPQQKDLPTGCVAGRTAGYPVPMSQVPSKQNAA